MNTNEQAAHRPGHTAEWLTEAADRLAARGDHKLAAEARAEAAAYWTPEPPVPAVVQHCDSCGHKVTSRKRLDRYADEHQLDWALCAKCEMGS